MPLFLPIHSHNDPQCYICKIETVSDEETIVGSVSSGGSISDWSEFAESSYGQDPKENRPPAPSRRVPAHEPKPQSLHLTKRSPSYRGEGDSTSSCSTLRSDDKVWNWLRGTPERPFVYPCQSTTPFDEDWFTLDRQVLDYRCQDRAPKNGKSHFIVGGLIPLNIFDGSFIPLLKVGTSHLWSSLVDLTYRRRSHV